MQCDSALHKKSKWVWSGNTTITQPLDVNTLIYVMLNIFKHDIPPQFLCALARCKHVLSMGVGNSVQPDQMASPEASWSGSTLFLKRINLNSTGQVLKGES